MRPDRYHPYAALPEGSIRLIKIHPTKAFRGKKDRSTFQILDEEEQVEISLETFELSQSPPYNALSYTWGLPGSPEDLRPGVFTPVERVFPVICEGAILPVTWNLRSALRHLRIDIEFSLTTQNDQNHDVKLLKNTYRKAPYFWIDAICINQEDLEERALQVQLMGQIYRRSSTTIAWLGEEDKFSNDAMDAFRRLGRIAKQAAVPVNLDSAEKEACARLLSRNWFTRSWIIQEVILSEKILVILGKKHVEFELYAVTCNLSQLSGFRADGREDPANSDSLLARDRAYGTIQTLEALQNGRELVSKGQLPSFMSIMNKCPAHHCSDPRDKIYSLLGISSEFSSAGKTLLIPDYTKSVTQVYTEATSFLITARKDLAVLNMVTELKTTLDLPSWTPDYRGFTTASINKFDEQTHIWRFPHRPEQPCQVSGRSLTVFGQCIGTVAEAVLFRDFNAKKKVKTDQLLSTGIGPILALLTRIKPGGSPKASQL